MTAYKPETTANGIHMLIDETDSILVGFIDSTANLSINSSYVFADRLHLTTCVVTGSATVNTVLATPAIVSPTGTVNFNDDHIITTGNITANVATVDSVNNADFVQFDTSYADGSVEGRLQWNIDDGTLEVGMPGGNVTLQIGQEMLVRCRNTTGSTINNGSVVYVSGESGNKPLIALSKADAKATAIVFGLATENIAHNANGYVTTTGLVRSMNTNGLVEGDYVFLSATTAGGLETAPATAPNYKARVGYCLSTHNSEGVVYVDSSVVPLMKSLSDVYGAPSADVDFYVWSTDNSRFEIKIGTGDAWPQYSHLKTGWKDHMQSFNEVEVTYNTSNRTYTISPLVAAAEYWIGGIRYELTESQSVVWDDTTGPHYIYFTGNETTLTASTTPWGFDDTKAFVSSGYWDSGNGIYVANAIELHSWCMHDQLHQYLHDTFGTRWESGLAVTQNQVELDALDITQGEIHDEDITITITDELGSGWWDQKLSALEAPILYREGDPGTWTRTTTINTDIVIFNGVVPQVNYPTGTDWNLEDVGVSRYFAYWVIASSDTNFPIFLVPGQEDGSSAADAIENNNLSDMDFGDLPSAEHKVIARIILQRQNLSPYIRIEQIDDYRGVSDEPKTGGGAVSNDHGNLLGLSDDDHLQYALANGTRAFTTNAAVGVLLVDTGNNNFGSTANASVIISGEDHTLNMTRGAIVAGSASTMNAATTQNSGIFVGNTNQISANDAVICGGADHFILGDYGFIGGGKDNDIGVNGVRAGMVGSSNSTANGYNNGMVGTYNSTTNGDQASILGGEDHTLNGTDSVIVGGQGCTVNDSTNSAILSSINSTLAGSSDSSIICGGQNHSVTANNAASLIAGGLDNTVNGDNSAVIAGYDNTANADQAAILAGQDNIVDEDNSVILGGYDCLTEKQNTVTYGKYAVNEHWGAFVHTGGRQNSDGDCQVIRGNMSAYTTNGVTADLTLDAIHAATTGNKLIMPENSIWYMKGWVVATNNIGNYGCGYAVHTCLQRNGSNQPVYMGLGTASANPTYYLLFEDNVNFNIGVAIQSGAVITITCTQPGISQSFKWNCAFDISQVIGGL